MAEFQHNKRVDEDDPRTFARGTGDRTCERCGLPVLRALVSVRSKLTERYLDLEPEPNHDGDIWVGEVSKEARRSAMSAQPQDVILDCRVVGGAELEQFAERSHPSLYVPHVCQR